ncbi:hypothetical protein I6E78_04730 [Pseudoalteromonas sp. NZS127]|uniref:hypothetical protein n=1 Tax=unclassified Pseudoalteromonas TaxID=194690 RepID=UPI0013FE4670|nr:MULTISPECIES: hypothetical protein [unclassified Pseudoalteromonas]MBH0071310.1 hypothetical protein [Pseudoalteromonas sp. NZS127]
MNDKTKKLDDVGIEEGIKNGELVESGTQIRDASTGQIVKVIKKKDEGCNSIPATLIQVHHSYVYQADLKPIIEAIVHAEENSLYEELEEQFNLVMDYFDSYNTYGTGIEKVHQTCLEISVLFDNKLRNEINRFDLKDIEGRDLVRFQGSLDAYVKIIFSYIVSTYILHKDKFSNDKVIIKKILSFENIVRSLYEQLLAESEPKENEEGKTIEMFSMSHSLYSMYMFDDDYDINDVSDLVCHDSRFTSALQVVDFFKRHFKKGSLNNQQSYPRYNHNENEVKICVSTDRIPPKSNRKELAIKLYFILEDIEKLKNIREEILQLKDYKNTDISTYFGTASANKALKSDS